MILVEGVAITMDIIVIISAIGMVIWWINFWIGRKE